MKILKNLLFCLLMTGCSLLPTSSLGGKQTALIKTQIINSGFTTKTVQSVYSAGSINHMELRMMAMPSGTVITTKDISQADLSKNITFSNLRANASYRVKAIAYKATGTNASDIISTDDASSSVDFTTTNNDAPTLATLKVQLVDKLFNGQGTSSIAVTPGGYTTGDSLINVPFAGRVVSIAGVSFLHDGIGTDAVLNSPRGMVVYNGYLYFTDGQSFCIRRMDLTTGAITTIAGTGTQGYADGIGTNAKFNFPEGIAYYSGCLYIADSGNARVRKLDLATNAVTTVAGDGSSAYADGFGTNAKFYGLAGMVEDNGYLYIADRHNQRIRKMNLATYEVTTLAGSTSGTGDGTGIGAHFYTPGDVTIYNGFLYVADTANHRIRKVALSDGAVTTIAGSTRGYLDATGTAAQFNNPYGIVGYNGSLYVSDSDNNRIRKVDLSTNAVTTVVGSTSGYLDATGTAAQFRTPDGMLVYNDFLYIADTNNNRLRRLNPATKVVTTVAGGNTSGGYADGSGSSAKFLYPSGLVYYNGYIYVADTSNSRIRKVDPASKEVTTIAGGTYGYADGIGTNAQFGGPVGLTAYNGALYIADSNNYRVRKLNLATNEVTTIAGGTYGNLDATTGTNAQFSMPAGITAYGGCLYIADTNNQIIRKIDLSNNNEVTTIAGQWYDYDNECIPYNADGIGTNARFCNPAGITAYNGYLYISDTENNCIRKLNLATNEVTTLAGNGTYGYQEGLGTNTMFGAPNGLIVVGNGLYVADTGNNRIRRIDLATNAVTTFAGDGNASFADGIAANARFKSPRDIAVDADGNFFVLDNNNNMIRGIY